MEIIPRSVWGARHDDGFAPAPLPAQECWLHHSVTPAPDPAPPYDADYAAVRTLEQIGEDRFGGGISYTWLITPAGLIFQGHSVNRQGAHTAGRNDRARAICFIGNYELAAPTPAQIRSAAWLLQQGQARGWLRYARLNGGHRDVSSTACPGRFAYAVISTINQLAAGPPITTEDDMLTVDDVKLLLTTKLQPYPGAPVAEHVTLHELLTRCTAQSTWAHQLRRDDADPASAVSAHGMLRDAAAPLSGEQLRQLAEQVAEQVAAHLPAGEVAAVSDADVERIAAAAARAVLDEQARRLAD